MEIHERLKALRLNAGYLNTKDVEKFAKLIGKGYTANHIYNFESGSRKAGQKIKENWAKACGLKYGETFTP